MRQSVAPLQKGAPDLAGCPAPPHFEDGDASRPHQLLLTTAWLPRFSIPSASSLRASSASHASGHAALTQREASRSTPAY